MNMDDLRYARKDRRRDEITCFSHEGQHVKPAENVFLEAVGVYLATTIGSVEAVNCLADIVGTKRIETTNETELRRA